MLLKVPEKLSVLIVTRRVVGLVWVFDVFASPSVGDSNLEQESEKLLVALLPTIFNCL